MTTSECVPCPPTQPDLGPLIGVIHTAPGKGILAKRGVTATERVGGEEILVGEGGGEY